MPGPYNDGDKMDSLIDLSPTGNDMTIPFAADPAARPTYRANALNGKGIIEFNDAGDLYESFVAVLGGALTPTPQPVTFVIVAKVNSFDINTLWGPFVAALTALIGINNQGRWYALVTSDNGATMPTGPAGTTEADLFWHVHVVILDGANSEWWIDGAQITMDPIGSDPVGFISIGSYGGGAPFRWFLAECGRFPGHASEEDVAALTNGMMEKWGLPNNAWVDPTPYVPPPNILPAQMASFESPTDPIPWTLPFGSATWGRSTEESHEGLASIRFEITAANNTSISFVSDYFPLLPEIEYNAKCWVKGFLTGIGSARLFFETFDASFGGLAGAASFNNTITMNWTKREYGAWTTSPGTAWGRLTVECYVETPTTEWTVGDLIYVDDFTVYNP